MVQFVGRCGNAVEIQRPYEQVHTARLDHGVFHVQFARVAGDCVPSSVGMFEIGSLVHFEPNELPLIEAKSFAPAPFLGATSAPLAVGSRAVTRNIGALRASIGDYA